MIVCVCHNVSEKELRSEIIAGAKTFAQLRDQLQIGTCCGKCAGCARQVLRETLKEHSPQAPSRFIPIHSLGLSNACA